MCTKRAYRTEKQARLACANMFLKGHSRQRYYYCERCGYYHTTSQRQRCSKYINYLI